jgi:hypothetical protein
MANWVVLKRWKWGDVTINLDMAITIEPAREKDIVGGGTLISMGAMSTGFVVENTFDEVVAMATRGQTPEVTAG